MTFASQPDFVSSRIASSPLRMRSSMPTRITSGLKFGTASNKARPHATFRLFQMVALADAVRTPEHKDDFQPEECAHVRFAVWNVMST